MGSLRSATSCVPATLSVQSALAAESYARTPTDYLRASTIWKGQNSARAAGKARIRWSGTATYSASVTYRRCINGVAAVGTSTEVRSYRGESWSKDDQVRTVRNVSRPVAKAKARRAAERESRSTVVRSIRSDARQRAIDAAISAGGGLLDRQQARHMPHDW